MERTPIRLVQHLHWRAGVGLAPAEAVELSAFPYEELVERLITDSATWAPIRIDLPSTTDYAYKNSKPGEQARFRKLNRAANDRANVRWCEAIASGKGALREKMALFWHGHFPAWSLWSVGTEQYLNLLREHALSDFGTMLKAVSRSAAMLRYLNSKKNVKDAPNENFAREVMELFTLGRGHYTEQDIKEGARAFTGWSFRMENAEFRILADKHDDGEKTFRGKTGRFGGEDILNMLLEDRQTAYFVCQRIHRWFVDPQTPNEDLVQRMADRFHASGHDIADLMRFVFLSPEFRSALGMRVKSPAELLLGLEKLIGVIYPTDADRIHFQRLLGQELLYPPSVAGWNEGRGWIDSGSLLMRLRLPSLLTDLPDPEDDEDERPDDDRTMGQMMMRRKQGEAAGARAICSITTAYQRLVQSVGVERLTEAVLQVDASPSLKAALVGASPEQAFVQVLSSPEYQLC